MRYVVYIEGILRKSSSTQKKSKSMATVSIKLYLVSHLILILMIFGPEDYFNTDVLCILHLETKNTTMSQCIEITEASKAKIHQNTTVLYET